MDLIRTELDGVVVLRPEAFEDGRGSFVKTFHQEQFRELGLAFEPGEIFYSVSHLKVVRGMHFLTPPRTQTRLVCCVAGRILDVVVDLHKGDAFGRVLARELSAANREMLFIPPGFAHGFLALTEPAVMVYHASPVHSPAHDAGIAWNSIPYEWPVRDPILSNRDRAFPSLRDFPSPF